jgi:hypothetical protein
MVQRWRGGRVSECLRIPCWRPSLWALPERGQKNHPNTLTSGRPNWPSQQKSRLVLFLFCCYLHT